MRVLHESLGFQNVGYKVMLIGNTKKSNGASMFKKTERKTDHSIG